MPSRAIETTYLVEIYRPGLGVGQLELCAAQVRDCLHDLARHGAKASFLFSVVVPDDEAVLVLLKAETERQVHDGLARAGVTFDRISIAIGDAAPASSAISDL